MSEHEILEHRWEDFCKKFAKLNRRAAKLGCAPCTFREIGRRMVERSYEVDNGDERRVKTVRVPARVVEVVGEAPRLADWQLVARTEELADGSCLIHTIPGYSGRVDQRFRSLGARVCEHCHTDRRRNDVYIVRHADGRELQVGRNCLADFTGTNSPESLASRMRWLRSVGEALDEGGDWTGVGLRDTHVDLVRALELTSMYIRAYGWVPKSAAGSGTPTAEEVYNHFSGHGPNRDRASKAMRSVGPTTEEDTLRAQETIRWVQTELARRDDRSDYEENLVRLVVGDLAETRHLGIVCSAVATALRVKSRAEERAAERKNLSASQHIGQVGERLQSCAVRVLSVRPMQGHYGATTLIKMVTTNGNLLTWFASGDWCLDPGHEAVIKATIKRHSEYQGIKETQVSRVAGL